VIEAAGLTYAPASTLPNTLHALQVTELARDRGLHEPVHTRLMHAYWSEQTDLGDDEVLLDLVAEAGLDRDEAAAVIADGRYADRVAASTEEANRHGIYAIPAFVLGGRLLVMGAQPEEVFEQAVEQLAASASGDAGEAQ
jgi:predicted DsbA family dithiol-disulfide isomerase